MQSYKIHANYKPRPWANLDGAVEIHENRDNVTTVNNMEHDRSYSFSAMLMPNQRLSVDFGYQLLEHIHTGVHLFPVFHSSANPTPPPTNLTVSTFPPGVPQLSTGTACPIAGSPSPLGALSTYSQQRSFRSRRE